MRRAWWLLLAYAAVVMALLPRQSLWLDELMEVVAASGTSFSSLIRGYVTHSAGQSPLGAIEQWCSIHAFGFSNFTARLPAAIASILAVWGMLRLAQACELRRPWLCALLFAAVPLQLRYATEGRPYSQMLCIAVWLTYFAVDLQQDADLPRVGVRFRYLALLVLGLYTQPFILFLAVAHWCWAGRREKAPLGFVIVAAALFYLPWYLTAHHHWAREINGEDLHFHWEAKLPLLIWRELLGSGYVGTAVAIAIASKARTRARSLLIWSVTLPVVLTVVADASFDYFFAIRQIIFVLPALLVLVASGLDARNPRTARVFAALFLALSLGYAARWFDKPRENWKRAADAIANNIGQSGCYVALPPSTASYYEFFRPGLRGRACGSSVPAEHVLAVSPYFRHADAADQSKVGAVRKNDLPLIEVLHGLSER